jgi:hypothetical protein
VLFIENSFVILIEEEEKIENPCVILIEEEKEIVPRWSR